MYIFSYAITDHCFLPFNLSNIKAGKNAKLLISDSLLQCIDNCKVDVYKVHVYVTFDKLPRQVSLYPKLN